MIIMEVFDEYAYQLSDLFVVPSISNLKNLKHEWHLYK